MIDCIFTVDYEIYGNGTGSLHDLVWEPAEKMLRVFDKWKSSFVPFVEVAELEMIESQRSDEAIDSVKQQIRDFYERGFDIGLHLHPQWYSAQYRGKIWQLNYDEYNLCKLPPERIGKFIERAKTYLRNCIGKSDYTPLSFRAGNGLFQPTALVSNILIQKGIKVDSSVFKGNVQHNIGMDYRRSLQNGYFWRFEEDVNIPNPRGSLIEIPVYTLMVPFWKIITPKRVTLQQKIPSPFKTPGQKLNRYLDFFRLMYPLKLDFCRMTLKELCSLMNRAIQADLKSPMLYKPIVAIGHTKELTDLESLDNFLSYLHEKRIEIRTLSEAYYRCRSFV